MKGIDKSVSWSIISRMIRLVSWNNTVELQEMLLNVHVYVELRNMAIEKQDDRGLNAGPLIRRTV
jgi:hypothetical protein